MTKSQAVALYDTKFWESMSYRERAMFQLFERRLCMPFSIFHEAVEKTLGRPVWTHEFGLNLEGLQREFLGEQSAPTMAEIVAMIPADKRVVVVC